MIIYGRKAKELTRAQPVVSCPHCGTLNSIDIYVIQKYAHVFWIPMFPMGKEGVSQCNHCKQLLKLREMPTALQNAYYEAKGTRKAPVWMYSGLILIAGLVLLGVIYDGKKDQRNAQLISAPKAGDILEVKTKDRQYTLYKVEEVQGDTVYLRVNNYETNKLSGLSDLRKKEFSEESFGFTKSELKNMLKEGEILDIERR